MEKQKRKLLIIEDSAIMQEMLRKSIMRIFSGSSSLHIQSATTCADARRLFKCFAPETVILDISLPDGSGISLLDEFRRMSASESMPDIYMLTSLNSPEIRNKCLASGASGFFDKSSLNSFLGFLETKLNNTNN